jgi:hypothetical protein
MRLFLGIVLVLGACRAQDEQSSVLATLRQMERAEQTGDANAWVGTWSRESAANAEKMRPYIRPRPESRYTASTVFVQGDQAAALVQSTVSGHASMRFVKETGLWKLKDVIWNDRAADPNSVYAMVPPPDGAFTRAGSPWQSVQAGLTEQESARRGWQMRAVHDESYLYVRIESPSALPLPGAAAELPPSGWPVLKVSVAGQPDIVITANANIGIHANQHFVYYLLLATTRAHDKIFEASAGPESNPLIQVNGRNFDSRIPLRALGITDASRAQIVVGDAAWPKSALVSVTAATYR